MKFGHSLVNVDIDQISDIQVKIYINKLFCIPYQHKSHNSQKARKPSLVIQLSDPQLASWNDPSPSPKKITAIEPQKQPKAYICNQM